MKRNVIIFSILSAMSLVGLGCDDNSDGKKASLCENGAKKCESSVVYMCLSGRWDAVLDCDYGCSGDVCADCTNDTVKCENDRSYVCSDGKWGEETVCENGCDGNVCSSETRECTNLNEFQCVEDVKYVCALNQWMFVESCEHGCDGNQCKKLHEKEFTACRYDEDFCADTILLTCDYNSQYRAVDCRDRSMICSTIKREEDVLQTGCFSVCDFEDVGDVSIRCNSDTSYDEYICKADERGNFVFQYNRSSECEHGCKDAACVKLDPLEYTECNPNSDEWSCNGNVMLRCEEDSLWHAIDCGEEENGVCGSFDGYVGCRKSCAQSDLGTKSSMCYNGCSLEYECSKDDYGIYALRSTGNNQVCCAHECVDGACVVYDELEGTECDSDVDKPRCNGKYASECIMDVWEAEDCSVFGEFYTCDIDTVNNRAVCKATDASPIKLNDVYPFFISIFLQCDSSFSEFCHGNNRIFCNFDEASSEGIGSLDWEECSSSCGVTLENGKSNAVCINPEIDGCVKQGWIDSCMDNYSYEVSNRRRCDMFSDGNLYLWGNEQTVYCANLCEEECQVEACQPGDSAKCNGKVVDTCTNVSSLNGFYWVGHDCGSDSTCVEDNGNAYCVKIKQQKNFSCLWCHVKTCIICYVHEMVFSKICTF